MESFFVYSAINLILERKGRKMMKRRSMKMFVLACAVLMMFCAGLTVSAKTTYKSGSKTKVYSGAFYKVLYEGKAVTDDQHPALLISGQIVIPYETCLVKRGPGVSASLTKSKKVLKLTYEGKHLKLYLNKKYYYVNGKKKKLPTATRYITMDGNRFIVVPGKAVCKALGFEYNYVKAEKTVYLTKKQSGVGAASSLSNKNLTAKDLQGLSTAEFIRLMGPLAQEDYRKTGVLASVSLAQMINESGWGTTTLCKQGNNIFGMKISLSGNTWAGSVWDGKSYVKIYTREEVKGKKVTVAAKFRKYPNLASSISDHSAYLKNAMNGSKKRYAGLTSTTSYKNQLNILRSGGYCTWSSYVSELTRIIKKYNLTIYDKK